LDFEGTSANGSQAEIEPMLHSESARLRDVFLKTPTVGEVHVIPFPKTARTAKIYGSARLRCFLGELKQIYDVILVAAPSVEEATEALTLAPAADAIIVFSRRGATADEALIACSTLEAIGPSPLLGAIYTSGRQVPTHHGFDSQRLRLLGDTRQA
jgi:Mrp family chromosome partitioning ATPase